MQGMGIQRRDAAPLLDDREAGFTVVESMAAAMILLIAIVLTITPIALAMRAIDRSKEVTVLENLAQARLEEIRSLDYLDVGSPGYAPDGILERNVERSISGQGYFVETDVQYVGATSGLDVIPQGGDGVEGAFDPGVNYKFVTVTVRPATGSAAPVTMETIIAPPTIGALENVAIVEVDLVRHEPYDPYLAADPTVQLVGSLTYLSTEIGDPQYFPDVADDTYEVSFFSDNGWVIHPDTVASGANFVDAQQGRSTTAVIRMYRPTSLTVPVVAADGTPITDATVTVSDQGGGWSVTNPPGDYTFPGLVPGLLTVTVSVPGFITTQVDVEAPGPGGGNSATVEVVPEPGSAGTTIDATFNVNYYAWADYFVHGAEVLVDHPLLGSWSGITDEDGNVTLQIPSFESGFTVTAQTPWGHEPVSTALTTGGVPIAETLELGFPPNTDRFALFDGPAGPEGNYRYRVRSLRNGRLVWSRWVDLPSNSLGKATFIVAEDGNRTVRIRAYCSKTSWIDEVYLPVTGYSQSWDPSGSCP